ncbi:hypothetical protein EMIHUDRAFT_235801 [Emiliania huxleyi CCMP1516]|uniref:Uncharacterized protein n=2 Tax=Emiliania huxleyi TaxID=2903 RepID=A0A0D3JVB9_EMIH1|nr:hypothetical protein EMIHUDRAFT_235801 [Emiliania huxleyi CCMP1516]EOD27454.1 hypothetical protein EMIHUDRAFT_235801 [Emiliania huxleyi CCMP1516]|eukprot:XP_005779883.1 hypothetical protein EMIHUDRAFT_235801 [Emiliania huxleyi CCMP1516]
MIATRFLRAAALLFAAAALLLIGLGHQSPAGTRKAEAEMRPVKSAELRRLVARIATAEPTGEAAADALEKGRAAEEAAEEAGAAAAVKRALQADLVVRWGLRLGRGARAPRQPSKMSQKICGPPSVPNQLERVGSTPRLLWSCNKLAAERATEGVPAEVMEFET